MNLLFVVYYPIFGGPHSQALRCAPHLATLGWRTTVLLPDEPGNAAKRLRDSNVEVVQLPLRRLRAKWTPGVHLEWLFNLPHEFRDLQEIIETRAIDLVVVNGLANPQTAIASKKSGAAVAWQLIDTFTPPVVRRALMPVVTRTADVVMATGRRVASLYPGTDRLGERLFYFFPPVDVQEFHASTAKRREARVELGLDESDIVVGNVSNINPQKGHATFLKAAALVRRQWPNSRFVILGQTYEHHQAYARHLWNQAHGLGLKLGTDLIVKDGGSRVATLASAFDIFWLTSEPRSEGIPTAVEEAMSLGLPVVAVDVGSIREVVEEGRTGFVVPPHNSDAISTQTDRILADRRLRLGLGRAARRRAVERYSVEACVETQASAFQTALNHRDHATA